MCSLVGILLPAEKPSKETLDLVTIALLPRNEAMHRSPELAAIQRLVADFGSSIRDLISYHIAWESDSTRSTAEFSSRKIAASSEEFLARVESKLQLVSIAESLMSDDNRNPPQVTTRTLQSQLIGAIAMSCGYATMYAAYRKIFQSDPSTIHQLGNSAKTMVQEYTQSKRLGIPQYSFIRESGPGHQRIHVVAISVKGYEPIEGTGKRKSVAEADAAQRWLNSHARSWVARTKPQTSRKTACDTEKVIQDTIYKDTSHIINLRNQFSLSEPSDELLHRSLVHVTYKVKNNLPVWYDNQTLSTIGSIIIQVALRDVAIKNLIASKSSMLDSFERTASLIGQWAVGKRLLDYVRCIQFKNVILTGDPSLKSGLNSHPDLAVRYYYSIIAASFLGQSSTCDPTLAVPSNYLSDYESALDQWMKGAVFRNPRRDLLLYIGLQRMGIKFLPVTDGVFIHHNKFNSRMRIWHQDPESSVVVTGGIGKTKDEAILNLSEILLPIIKSLHWDFQRANELGSPGLVSRIAPLFLKASIIELPSKKTKLSVQWYENGLLGAKLVKEKKFNEVEHWFNMACSLGMGEGISENVLRNRLLDYYSCAGISPNWDATNFIKGIAKKIRKICRKEGAPERMDRTEVEGLIQHITSFLIALRISGQLERNEANVASICEEVQLLNRGKLSISITTGGEIVPSGPKGSLRELLNHLIGHFDLYGITPGIEVSVSPTISGVTQFCVALSVPPTSAHESANILAIKLPLVQYMKAMNLCAVTGIADGSISVQFIASSEDSSFAGQIQRLIENPFGNLDARAREMLATIVHDLKNSLVAALATSDTKQVGRTAQLRALAMTSESLDIADALCEQIEDLAGSFVDLELEDFDVNAVMRDYCASLFSRIPPGIVFTLPRSTQTAVVTTSRMILLAILENLTKNAWEALRGSGELAIDWIYDPEGQKLLVSVKNIGSQVSDSVLSMVNGSAISKGSTSGGSGVGIYAVKRMLDRLGGGIEAQGIAGQFIEITIEIPCYEINEKVTHIVSFENTEISVEN